LERVNSPDAADVMKIIAVVLLFCLLAAAGCAQRKAPNTATPRGADMPADEQDSLNRQISILIDADALHRICARTAHDEAASESILGIADKRDSQRRLLQEYVLNAGGSPDEFGEALGVGHRVFMRARTVFEPDKKVAIEEVLRGEYYILKIAGGMDKELAGIRRSSGLEDMMKDVQGDIDRLETMLRESGWPEFGPH